MQIAVLGTGEVGRRLASRLVSVGHEVMLGSRTANNSAASSWAMEAGGEHGTFSSAASFGSVVINAVGGLVSIEALSAAGAANLAGKVLVDVSNPLDFSRGFPPRVVTFGDGHSLAEEIQRTFPDAQVVKTLNTMNNTVMVDPSRVGGHHNVFVSGDSPSAKALVVSLLVSFGWTSEQIIDLGALSTARGVELMLPFWASVYQAIGPGDYNLAIARG